MPASIGVNMRVTGHHSQGGRKYMEDKFSVAYQQTEDENDLEYAYFGIFDGHGGSEAAAFAKEHLMDSIVKQRLFWSDSDDDVLRAIRNGYMMTHMNMWKELDRWPKTTTGLPSTAGTTASVAFIRRGKIYIGHVGDSAIVLGYQVEGRDDWCARPLTLDHKPETPAERSRIQSSGGKVIAKAGVPRVVWNRPAPPGPAGPRCDEIPFLAVARSLGDLWSYNVHSDEFVVSPDPDVGVLSIDPARFRCLIFGTDGLWNMVSADAAVQLVQAAERHNERAPPEAPPPDAWLNPSKILVDSALQRWSSTKMRADNTSVVTLMMDPPGPPRNRAPHPREPAVAPRQNASPAGAEATNESVSESYPAPSPCPPTPECSNAEDTEADAEPEPTSEVAARGLSIVTRFPDPRPVPPLLTSPPHLDHAYSPEDGDALITNYGNPAESYFITRLLNKTQLRNTLHDVSEEISRVAASPLGVEGSASNNNNLEDETFTKSASQGSSVVSPVEESTDKDSEDNDNLEIEQTSEEGAENSTETKENDESLNLSTELQESIQINEVSSSSPVDAPNKNKKRRSKGARCNPGVALPPGRNLRSHDTPPAQPRPHTRLANRTRTGSTPPKAKPVDSKVPVPVHTVKSPPQSVPEKVVILNRPKLSISPTVVLRQMPVKPDESKVVKIQKNFPPEVKNKVTEKGDGKSRLTPVKPVTEPPKVNNNTRVTRSKDPQPSAADILLKAVRDTANNGLKKEHSSEGDAPAVKREDRPTILTRHRTNGTAAHASSPQRAGGTFLRGRGREQALDNTESSKENVLAPSTGPGSAVKSTKRRNSGGALHELEPKEKRRTRLDDKRSSKPNRLIEEQHQDVSSTQQFKDSAFLLGLRIGPAETAEQPGRRSLRSAEDVAEPSSPLASKVKNKKEKKLGKLGLAPDDGASGEVHSTTASLGTESLGTRGSRSRSDVMPLPLKKLDEAGERRALRSTDCTADKTSVDAILGEKECRPVLRSRNSVGTPGSRVPPRRRAPWPPAPRSLRKRLTK